MKTGDADDPLPDGWTVKVKVRPSGKKDKCYFPPSGEGKFYSKLDVARYLKNNTPESEQKENGINQHSPQNVASERCGPEGLPPGWTKEIKVTKKGRKIRRDSYYTDPVSGYVFRSMKDALRYLETGELGKRAIRPKEKSSNNFELENDEACSPAVAKKQKLEVSRTRSPNISNQRSNFSKVADDKLVHSPVGMGEVANDEHVRSPAVTGESPPVFEHISGEESQANNSGVQESKSFQRKERCNNLNSKIVANVGGALPNKHNLDSRTIKGESKTSPLGKSKKKNYLSLPRRTSKRLSGLPLEPTPELKSTNRACRAAVKQSNDETSAAMGSLPTELKEKYAFATSKSTNEILKSRKSKHPIDLAAVGELETENMACEKPESASISGNLVEKENIAKLENAIISEVVGKIPTDNIDDEKAVLDLPLGELCQDPCIAFAIKTLTGISFDTTTDTVQVSTGSNSDFGGSLQNGVHSQQECSADQTLKNDAPGKQVEELEVSNNDNGKPGSPLNLSFADAWADPCIEFAIKTLTGAIPLEDVVIQDFIQPRASSSQSHESSGLSLQNVAQIGQSRIFCEQFRCPEMPSYNQGAMMEPGIQHNMNMNVGYGTFHARCSEERSKGSLR